ncbi:MAG: CDP-alcohol phosphatidyltransferase family protein [Chloroflexota bacterium]
MIFFKDKPTDKHEYHQHARLEVQRWSMFHAFVMLVAYALCLWLNSPIPLTLVMLGSFALLIISFWEIVPSDSVTLQPVQFWRVPANWVTLFRFLLICTIGLIAPIDPTQLAQHNWMYVIAGAGLLNICLDYVDGYFATRYATTSVFGGYFDMESDAYFVSLYSMLLYMQGLLPIWVLTFGLLRYVYVVVLVVLRQNHKKEPRIFIMRFIAVLVMIAMLVPYVTPSLFFVPFVAISCIILNGSFTYSFILHVRQPG